VKKVSVSEARAKLFDLVEQVTAHPQEEVVIEHRSQKGRAVLVDAGHYEYLKAAAAGLRQLRERPFKLKGSMQLTVPPEEFDEWFEENRRRASAAADAKFGDL